MSRYYAAVRYSYRRQLEVQRALDIEEGCSSEVGPEFTVRQGFSSGAIRQLCSAEARSSTGNSPEEGSHQ